MFVCLEKGLRALGTAVGLLLLGCAKGPESQSAGAIDSHTASVKRAQTSDSLRWCQPGTTTVSVSNVSSPRDLAGTYDLVVVAQDGGHRDSVAVGRLVLDTTTAITAAPNSTISLPLSGNSNVDLTRLGAVSLAYPASSTDPQLPGVQVMYDSSARNYRLVFGNALSPSGSRRDAGVYFDVVTIEPDGRISGHWRNGGRIHPVAHGYFCAKRTAN